MRERLARVQGHRSIAHLPDGIPSKLRPHPPARRRSGTLIISDELNHGSIIDGVRLAKGDRAVYKHNDMNDLARVLDEAEKHAPAYRRILIITDGVFSMDGDIAPLDQVAKLGSRTRRDGLRRRRPRRRSPRRKGKGDRRATSTSTTEKVQVEMGTFSKAYGTVGGHISGSEDLVKFALEQEPNVAPQPHPTPPQWSRQR